MNLDKVEELNDQLSDYDDDEGDRYEDDLVDIGLVQDEDNNSGNNDEKLKTKLFLSSSTLYPCKLGGKPQWLHLNNLPTDLRCSHCESQLIFLLQIYAPLNNQDETQEGFHRYLFVFICTSSTCPNTNRTVRLYRSQMNRENDTYSFEAPPDRSNSSLNEIKDYLTVFYKNVLKQHGSLKFCNVCGLPSNKKCAKCKFMFYCNEEHQKLDWLSFGHKQVCGQYCAENNNTDEIVKKYIENELLNKELSSNSAVFPQYEILIEQEELDDEDVDINDIDQQKINEQLELNKDLSKDLEGMPENEYDEDFLKFKKRIKSNPKQVIRYDRCGKPLWATKNGKLSEEKIPNCELCDSKRVFEFQIMPQMLSYLKIEEDADMKNSLDWAGIYVYTCERNCTRKEYSSEFVVKQEFN